MDEKDFVSTMNTAFISRGGFGHKMPDPSFQEIMRGAPKRPYDMYAILKGISYHIEAKFLKGYQAFNFKRVEEHQYENLLKISYNKTKMILPIVAVAIWVPRTTYDVFFFDIEVLDELRKHMGSINKKTLIGLRSEDRYLTVKKNDLDVEKISEVLIWDVNSIKFL